MVSSNAGTCLTPKRTRAILEAATLLYEHARDRNGAIDLVLGIRRSDWTVAEWAELRRELGRRLANRRWSESEIADAIHSDRRTVARWIGK
jgi:hypothetical protein